MRLVSGSTWTSPIQSYLEQLHQKCRALHDGEVASYIPELARANPHWFGICLATTDGQVYEVGDTRRPFTIQSISKPFIYGLALEDCGKDAVLQKIGVEPSGDTFNSISLYPDSGRPFNPMINAGAIATTGLVRGKDSADSLRRILQMFARYVGHRVTIDHLVYQSEKSTGYRNRAIGFMLRNFDILRRDPEPVVDLYFQQCSVAVTCRDLAVMAATLAHGGFNPLTRQRAVRQEYVESILSILSSCGMYDAAGEWIYEVGMPAKSGVAGGILAVLPGQLGIGVFSPPLDSHGNSVRGIRVCQEISRDFNLHLFNVPVVATSAIRTQYDAAQISSRRLRGAQASGVLRDHGNRIHVYELQGDLMFSTAEVIVRTIGTSIETVDYIVLDLKRVTKIDTVACALFWQLLQTMRAQGRILVFSQIERTSPLVMYCLRQKATEDQQEPIFFAEHDLALEWCENQLLARSMALAATDVPVSLAEHQLCQGMSTQELQHLQNLLQPLTFTIGEYIIKAGEAADHMYLLVQGEASVTVRAPTGRPKRLSTLAPGMAFGEMAVIDRSPRSADVRADTPVQCYALSLADFDRLGESNPVLKTKLLENLLHNVSQMLRKLSQEMSVLAE